MLWVGWENWLYNFFQVRSGYFQDQLKPQFFGPVLLGNIDYNIIMLVDNSWSGNWVYKVILF